MGCDTSGIKLTGYIYLDNKINGTWHWVDRQWVSIRSTIANHKYTRQNVASCSSGTYRNRSVLKGTYQGYSQSDTSQSQTVTISC